MIVAGLVAATLATVSVDADGRIGRSDVPAQRARARLRGRGRRSGRAGAGRSASRRSRTRSRSATASAAPLLGLPADDDWILYSAYNDRTLIRNVLAYETARSMGRYAARTRFVELRLNGRYHGVYVLMEKLELPRPRARRASCSR